MQLLTGTQHGDSNIIQRERSDQQPFRLRCSWSHVLADNQKLVPWWSEREAWTILWISLLPHIKDWQFFLQRCITWQWSRTYERRTTLDVLPGRYGLELMRETYITILLQHTWWRDDNNRMNETAGSRQLHKREKFRRLAFSRKSFCVFYFWCPYKGL